MPRSEDKSFKSIPLWKRFYNFLKAVDKKDSLRVTSRNHLFYLAIHKGYSKSVIWDSLNRLDKEYNIGSFKEEDKGVVYKYYKMTKEELKKKKEDDKWFNDLPDK